jgi:hypothetical protein
MRRGPPSFFYKKGARAPGHARMPPPTAHPLSLPDLDSRSQCAVAEQDRQFFRAGMPFASLQVTCQRAHTPKTGRCAHFYIPLNFEISQYFASWPAG